MPTARDVKRIAANLVDRLRDPSPRWKWMIFGGVFFFSAWYLILSATLAERSLFPILHDEHMYLLQARMLAGGRLWMPHHELAPFFESFHIITTPVYAATYFPGTALFYVPGIWLHVAPWITGIIITALAVAMFYLVMTELFDGVAGLLASLLAVSLQQLRVLSIMTESHPAMLLLLLAAVWFYLRWRGSKRLGWAAAFGAAAGWAAITRPLDAVCLVGPLCIVLTWDVFRRQAGDVERRFAGMFAIFAIVIAAAPFLLLQLVFDKHVTGHALQTPFGQYAHTTFPGLEFGYGVRNPMLESPSPLPQVRDYYRDFFRPDLTRYGRTSFVRMWLGERLAPVADVALPAHALYALLPLGLIYCFRRSPHIALAAGVLTLPLAYTFYPSYLRHYGLVCAPAFFTLVLGGESLLCRFLPRSFSAVVLLAIAFLCLASLPEFRGSRDPAAQAPYLADINGKLANLDHVPAVVLFHYDSGRTDLHEEPVYNLDTINPDDAEVIRAHDLGAENWRIFHYYAQHQPERFFYLYNRSTAQLTPLGYARDLDKK